MNALSLRWAFDLISWNPGVGDLALALSSVQPEELTRIERFVFRRDALASLVGRLLSRLYCCQASGLPWDQVKLERDGNNKPFMRGHEDIKFNVSHQGKYAVLAGDRHVGRLGVDVMKQEYTGGKPLSEFFRLMNRNFASSEWKHILSSPHHQTDRFFRLWTLKESYVKATGTGITVPLDEIEFKIESELNDREFIEDTKLSVKSVEQVGWVFQEMQLDDEHCVSVALSDLPSHYTTSKCFSMLNFDDIKPKCQTITPLEPEAAAKLLAKPFAP